MKYQWSFSLCQQQFHLLFWYLFAFWLTGRSCYPGAFASGLPAFCTSGCIWLDYGLKEGVNTPEFKIDSSIPFSIFNIPL